MNRPVDPAVVLGVALVAGSLAVVAPAEVCVASAIAGCWTLRSNRIGWWLAIAASGCVLLGLVRGTGAVASYERERRVAAAAMGLPERCGARGHVVASPVRTRDVLRWDAELTRVECEDRPIAWQGRATLYGGPPDLARGDDVEIVATLGEPQRLWNVATGDPRPGEARRHALRTGGALDVRVVRRGVGYFAWVDRTRAAVRARIDATFAKTVAPMARALVLGESDLSADDDRSFRAAGLSHLLAVSGMHLVLVLAAVVKLLEAALVRVESIAARIDVGRIAGAVGVFAAWWYAELAGGGGSTVRAAWMATVGLGARALGRRTDGPRAFGMSMVAMAVVDPLVAFDLSFVLSAGATAGLLAFARPFSERLEAWAPPPLAPIARAAGTTLAATIPCTPIVARFAPAVPLGGVLANLLAVPIGESVALPLCLVHALLSWWPAAERGCAVVASGALIVVRFVARGFAAPAFAVEIPPPTSWQLVIVALALAALALRVRPRGAILSVCAVSALVLEMFVRRSQSPRGILRVTFVDVGQGDCAIVDLPNGQAMVVDGGGLVGSPIDTGLRALAPELRARRRTNLAAVVLSHPHPDHFGGLATGLDAVRYEQLWDTGEGEVEGVGGGYATLLGTSRSRAVPVLRPGELCGAREVGGVRVDVLAPCPAFSSDRGANDNSLVLRLTYGQRSILLVGDAESAAEDALLATARDRLRADVLKVGHHGSRTSSGPSFIAAVAPREAVISVGCRNRFGHPHPSTLRTLEAAGARVWRTDRDGAVVVTTDGRSLDVDAVGTDGRPEDGSLVAR